MAIAKSFFWFLIFLLVNFFLVVPSFGQNSGVFESDEILEITLKGDARSLFNNTKGEAEYFDFWVSAKGNTGDQQEIQLRIKTRGHFRREMNICEFPPLLLNFAKEEVENTIFSGQDKVKLVMPCQGDKYVLREFYAYKLYNLLTPKSFKVRLVRLSVEDQSDKPKQFDSILGFLIEEEDQMAARNQLIALDRELIQPQAIPKEEFLRMAVFQYLIGNTDWSIQYRQNIKLIRSAEQQYPIAVPYDFDHAGIVRAPYANPAAELKLVAITDRRYRGYCLEDMKEFDAVFSDFLEKKEVIYALYEKSEWLDEKSIKSTLKFIDGFYETITNPKRAKLDFLYPCLPDGTGNIIIRGLN